MNSQEARMQESRVEKYKALCLLRSKYNHLLNLITRSDPEGPCQQGPFTGNTRESRKVEVMTLEFSCTRGGAPRPQNIKLLDMDLEAYALGSFLQNHLNKKIKEVDDQIEAL